MLTKGIDNDWALIDNIKSAEKSSFETIYKKYAAMMFGCILNVCKDRKKADQIFKRVFLNLRDVQVSNKGSVPFAFWLWRHTGIEAMKFMKDRVNNMAPDDQGIIDHLLFQKINPQQAATSLKISNEEIGLLLKKALKNTY